MATKQIKNEEHIVEQNVIMCCFSDFNQRDSNIAKNM
jgi:hypothetical protein